MPKCPSCECDDVARSRFRWADVPWAILLFLPMRCRECGRRFRRFLLTA